MPKVVVLFFDSKDIVTMKKAEVKQGKIKISQGTYIVNEEMKPKIIKSGKVFPSYRPFFIIRHDKVSPLDWNDDGQKGQLFTPDPVTMTDIIKNKRLQDLVKVKTDKLTIALFVIAGIAGGVLLGFMLTVFHIL